MTSIIIFSTLWKNFLNEWKGTSLRARLWITAGMVVLIFSTVIIGVGITIQMTVSG